jgi:flagellin
MTRINTNMPSLIGAQYLNRNMQILNKVLERLATGRRINSAKDDPSGIIISDVFRGELTGIQGAIANAERANNLLATAETAMGEIGNLLLSIKQAVHEVANSGTLTAEEVAAKQLQIDNYVAAIDKISDNTSYAGLTPINGALSYRTSHVDGAAIAGMAVHKAPVGLVTTVLPMRVEVVEPASRGELIMAQAAITGDVSIELSGPRGKTTLEFKAGTTSQQIALAVNSTADKTGLRAELVDPGNPAAGVRIQTDRHGSRRVVSVTMLSGNASDFPLQDTGGNTAYRAAGRDIRALVNGGTAAGDGLTIRYMSVSMNIELAATEAFNVAGQLTNFQIDGGGAIFQLGPRIGSDQQDTLGIGSISSSNLGWADVGFLSDIVSGGSMSLTSANIDDIGRIVDTALTRLNSDRARLGSFQNNNLAMVLATLRQSFESISASRSNVLDADYAEEVAAMTRMEVLGEATRAAMAMAQQVPRHVLNLLISS